MLSIVCISIHLDYFFPTHLHYIYIPTHLEAAASRKSEYLTEAANSNIRNDDIHLISHKPSQNRNIIISGSSANSSMKCDPN